MPEVKDQARLTELKSALKDRMDKMDAVVGAVTIEDNGGVVVSQQKADDFRKNLSEAQAIQQEIKALEGYSELRNYMDAPAGPSIAAQTGALLGLGEAKSLGQMFVESPEFKELIQSGGSTMRQAWNIEVGDIASYGQKDVYTAMSGLSRTIPGFGRVQFDPMVPRETRRSRVRDLFPVAPTSANLIDFFRVVGFGTDRLDLSSGASVVPERASNAFGLKPQSNLTYEVDQAPVRTIAHWEAAHRNVLNDEPQLRATIDNELLYGLRLEEDHQILSGTGTGEDLRGILNTTGVQTITQAGGDTMIDVLRRAATKVMLAYYEPTGYVLHPNDWEGVELTKATDGHYQLVTNVAIGAQAQVWRQPVVDTPAITEGTFLTGAFGLGAQLYDRQTASIRIAEQHSDFFIRNAVAILAEERIALAVKRPESFVKGTFS